MQFVVIVDDRATNRSIFSKLAGSLGEHIEVEAFAAPDPALKWIGAKIPDLIITDYKMPQMTGAAFTQQIRALPNGMDVPIIVITAYDDRAFRLEALEAGATDFVQTPIDHQEFVTRARNLLKIGTRQKLIRSRAFALAKELQDIEQERQELLRDSRDRLAQVIDTVPAMISASDRRGECIFVNAYQTSALGEDTDGGVTGFKGEHAQRSRQLDARVFATELPLPAFEEEMTDASGDEDAAEVDVQPRDVGIDHLAGHYRTQARRAAPASRRASRCLDRAAEPFAGSSSTGRYDRRRFG
jgi:CheY-like chemotaxis protein